MASAKKRYTPHRGPTPTDAHVYAEFVKDLLDGTIKATALDDRRDGQGRLRPLDYDDPNG
jgi:hypothetical protein